MSITLFALAAAAASAAAEAAPDIMRAAGDFLRENRHMVHGLVKSSKPVISEFSDKAGEIVGNCIDVVKDEVTKYKDDGWEEE